MDNTIYVLKDRHLVRVGDPKAPPFTLPGTSEERGPEERQNFLIVCEPGDWSGFRTLEGCLKQFHNDPTMLNRSDYYFSIVERL